MPMTDVQETCARNLYKKLAKQKWPTGKTCFVNTCSISRKKLAQEKSWCKLLQVGMTDLQVSCTSFLYVCHRHYSVGRFMMGAINATHDTHWPVVTWFCRCHKVWSVHTTGVAVKSRACRADGRTGTGQASANVISQLCADQRTAACKLQRAMHRHENLGSWNYRFLGCIECRMCIMQPVATDDLVAWVYPSRDRDVLKRLNGSSGDSRDPISGRILPIAKYRNTSCIRCGLRQITLVYYTLQIIVQILT